MAFKLVLDSFSQVRVKTRWLVFGGKVSSWRTRGGEKDIADTGIMINSLDAKQKNI